jgi:dynein intermediate chain
MVSVSTSTSDDLYLAPPAPPKPKVVYDKSIQTSSDLYSLPSTSTSKGTTNDAAGGVGRENAEEMRARIIGELEEERRKVEEEISEENRRLAVEQESLLAKGLSAPEIDSLLASPPFMDFLSTSSKIVQRALSDSYDYLKDYTATSEGLDSKEDGARVRLLGSWYDEKWGKGRSVTGVDWSPKVSPITYAEILRLMGRRWQFPELFAASYNKNPMAVNEPDGIACIWNLHLLERPEFVFHAQVRPSIASSRAIP